MKVVLLAGEGDSSWIVANKLHPAVSLATIIIERPMARGRFLRMRAKRYGWLSAAGQMMFICYAKLLRMGSRARLSQLMGGHDFSVSPPLGVEVVRVNSANDWGTIELLQKIAPKVVIVNGTRILSKQLLSEVKAVFINMHAGITPKYRGAHGGYWALACGDAENAGVTVHLVDSGIDTGAVLYQDRISSTPSDNFVTYPMLQLAAGIPLLIRAAEDALGDRLQSVRPEHPSQIFAHPTLWKYLWLRIVAGIR
jgi:hypothetical protein